MMWMRWLGRAIGLLASAFFLAFVVGEGLTGYAVEGLPGELLPFLPLLLLAVIGSVATLFRPRVGGLLQIAGGAAMAVYHLAHGGMADLNMALAFGAPFIVAGLLALLHLPVSAAATAH